MRNIQGWAGLVAAVLAAAIVPGRSPALAQPAPPPATQEWLKAARLGPYVEPRFDAAVLYEQARREGAVTVYSYSSRIHAIGSTFEKQYPGIKVNAFDLDGAEIITKVLAEQRARNYQADLIFLPEVATVKHQLMPRWMVFNYVPPDLVTKIPRQYREPLLARHFSFRVVFYNNERYASPPVNNLWDLTRPEWKGRVMLPDPLKIPEYLSFLVTVVQRADEMAAAHQRKYGELRLSPGIENAGYEWIRRLLANDLIIAPSTDEVTNAIGRPGQTAPPIGISAWSRMRDKVRRPTLRFEPALAMEPVAAVSDLTILAIPAHAPHPAAAKLLIRWMMGDEKGGQGFEPFYIEGHLPTRTDVPPPPGMPMLYHLKVWDQDYDVIWKQSNKVREFWLRYLR
ncbi:MAG: substrate-binding domain-containing protein [Armatimonadota bacterium]|nr:substrate-binding domain-containing protein [Armatimonadota bacterium]